MHRKRTVRYSTFFLASAILAVVILYLADVLAKTPGHERDKHEMFIAKTQLSMRSVIIAGVLQTYEELIDAVKERSETGGRCEWCNGTIRISPDLDAWRNLGPGSAEVAIVCVKNGRQTSFGIGFDRRHMMIKTAHLPDWALPEE